MLRRKMYICTKKPHMFAINIIQLYGFFKSFLTVTSVHLLVYAHT